MLESCTTAQERWGGVHKLIDAWLAERKQLITEYTRLHNRSTAGQHPDTALSAFCDVLVDYMSAGHFEIYEQLVREAEDFKDQRGLDLAEQLYPRIQNITEQAVAFNDLYADTPAAVDEANMQSQLSNLGALLHERFELEDCLIEVLHTAHRDLLSTP